MKRLVLFLTIPAMALVLVFGWYSRMPSEQKDSEPGLPAPCLDRSFEGQPFIVCTVDLSAYSIQFKLNGLDGNPYRHLDRLVKPFVLAMNTGMYHADFSPVGLYVENGKEISALNMAGGEGNFFMKPNGVFFIDESGKPGVLETRAYAAAGIRSRFATQSGPMLVIDGDVHPRFEPDGQSRYIRNGVGVDESGRVVLAISRVPVSLGRFGRLFRDALVCNNALFLDGGISALHDGRRYIIGGEHPAGPMLVVKRDVE